MRILGVLMLLLVSVICGCSSGSDTPAALQGAGLAPSQPGQTRTVVARLYLGLPAVSQRATVRLEDLSGARLAEGETLRDGLTIFKNVTLPSDFRAIARINGSSIEFSAEIRGLKERWPIVINVLTTLTSRYLREHPGLDLPTAEARVRQALGLPQVLLLDAGIHEGPAGFFSHVNFFQAASRQGGFEALVQQVLQRIDAGQAAIPYQLTYEDLQAPVRGLGDAALDLQANQAAALLRRRLGLPARPPARAALRGPILAAEGPTTLKGQFLLGVGTGITGNLITGVANDIFLGTFHAVFGWAINQLGLNYGTTGQLNEIYTTLLDVQQELLNLTTTVNDENLANQLQTLNLLLAPAQTANKEMITTLSNANITNQPAFNLPSGYSNLISDIRSPNYITILSQVQAGLTGPLGAIMTGQNLITSQQQGLDAPSSMQSFPWRTDGTLAQALKIYDYYALQQTQTLNLYAEQAHNFLINPNPVQGVLNILPTFRVGVAALKTQRQQQTLPNRHGVITDLENGVMWQDWLVSARTYDEALTVCQQSPIQLVCPDGSSVTYNDWRLPTYGEYQSLRDRGTYCPNYDPSVPVPSGSPGPYPDSGSATAGLPAMGFANISENFGEEDTQNSDSNGSNGDAWMSYYELSYNGYDYSIDSKSYVEYRMNEGSTDGKNSSDDNCFFMIRTVGPTPLVNPYSDVESGVPQPYPVPSPVVAPTPTAGEAALFGVPTSINSIAVRPASPQAVPNPSPGGSPAVLPLTGCLQLSASLTYQINLGGDFSLGYGTTVSRSNPSINYSGTVSTADPSGANNLLGDLITWSSSAPEGVEVSNLPYLSGVAIPYGLSPVNLGASILGAGGKAVTYQQAYTPTATAPHVLQSIQLSPRNQTYGTSTQPVNTSYPYFCTGFYQDRAMATLGSNTTWTVNPSGAGATITQAEGGPVLQLNPPYASASPYLVQITATVNGTFVDNTTIQIIPPPPASPTPTPAPSVAPLPGIASLNPTTGRVRGGTAVTIRGENLGTTTNVTFGGVAASFTINTSSEITAFSPEVSAPGPVTVVVTTPQGTASAGFTYTQ